MASSLTPREHVEKIRRETFYIGREEKNPLARFLHQAVTYLSEELYTKDSHFITELIQNAQDNEYEEGVVPTLEFVVTDRDLTRTGATTTLLVFNNERGFTPANVESICGVGQSIKKGNRHRGYVGEKGIGFKSVFLVCSQPHIFSRGYQIKLNEKPSPDCNIGYIVPEWVENNPCMHELEQVYDSSSKTMPTTTIILPLKSDKVKTVMDQLSDIHPEILLFLSKIRSLSVREDKTNSKVSAERSLSISSEINFQVQKNMDAESFTLHLTNQGRESGKEETCSYYMWRQKFPVKPENRVEKRKEVEEWTITLAFPHGPRLRAGMELPGIYAFLPTGMVTNFPFIIQADFILVSSRETILLDNAWNVGILESVAPAFRNALLELVKSNAEIPLSLIPDLFRFLPTKNSNFPELEKVRIRIKDLLVAEDIIPCETYMEQRIFCKGSEVGRLKPAFWDILDGARKANVNLCNISCHGTQILSPSFDDCRYDSILEFLGVGYVSVDWYGKFIKDTNIAAELPETVYLDLLCFIASNWDGCFSRSNVTGAPLLKVVTDNGGVALWTVDQATRSSERIRLLSDLSELPWLIKWNREFKYVSKLFFVPQATQVAMNTYSSQWTVKTWLSDCASVHTLSLQDYCTSLLTAARGSQKHLINFTHFLFHSISRKENLNWQVKKMCESLPLVDNYGSIIHRYEGVLLPAHYSKWVELVGSNPWRSENYVELSQDYGREASFAAGCNITPRGGLLNFLRSHVGASDVPDICPPNAKFPTASSRLSKKNAFLLLDWIRNLKRRGVRIPDKFMHCVKSGPWLETSLGAKAPEVSFLSNSEWGNLLQMGPLLIDLPLVKHEYYDHRINDYKDELKMLGVMSEFREACQFIGKHFISKVGLSSNLSSRSVVSMLEFIRFLTQRFLPTTDFVNSIKEARWLKTCHGYKSPDVAILQDSDWYSASCISDLPFIDRIYYDENFHAYKSELALLGVTVGFDHRRHSQLVIDNTRDLISSKSLSSNDVAFMLECIRNARNTHHLVDKLRAQKWVVTKLGPKCPEESTLFDPEWECVFKVVDNLPLIDEKFYGAGIRGYKAELRTLGVLVDLEDVLNAVIGKLKLLGSSNCSLNKAKACALLACYRRLLEKKVVLKPEFNDFVCKAAWLQTNLGCRSPANSILFNEEWAPISAVASLPFIDYGGKCHGEEIQKYKAELKALGVAVEFEEGVGFVMEGINLPSNPSEITSRSALSLFECIRIMRKKELDLTDEFLRGIISKKWLKTSLGYKSPRGCALFGPEWAPFLELGDAAFIDESFYGSEITDYRDELHTIGVIVYPFLGNEIVADRLKKHDADMKTVIRIYSFLRKNKWKARKQEHHSLIYVPNNSNGEWVTPESCILHDKDNLFGMKLHVLERYYDKELLRFFGESFGVMSSPSITHYHDLWNDWETTKQHLTESECSSVWTSFVRGFSIESSPSLLLSLRKLPVMTTTGGIMLAEREDVFIPDDLLLKDLFDKASDTTSLFVWHPMTCSPFMSTSKLFGVYSQLGVQNISTAVSKSEISVPTSRKVLGGDKLFGIGLFRLLLGFLADPSLGMSNEKRQGIVQSLLDVNILETDEPICCHYDLMLSSGKVVRVSSTGNFRWDREASKFYVHDTHVRSSKKASINSAIHFAQVLSEGLIWEEAEHIPRLAELIRLGYLIDFDEDAIYFLLKSENLQLFREDEALLSSKFSSSIQSLPSC